ncbi:hypothetical protein [Asticcacaulis sp. YBE204]|uniref:hypothetical protein n=1 Tax=Asticcacaulis sp. YBE204 TaxID=1282363 RepID=UPI0012DFB2D2|nr:hypothetical protein [Asticcacaulis sp. YBE204]
MTKPYPTDFDIVWCAKDKKDAVAVFLTAGQGPFPEEIADTDWVALESNLLSLPITTEARLIVTVPRPEGYAEFAIRGLYVYDWRDAHRSHAEESSLYECVAVPTIPIGSSAVREKLPYLENVSFEDSLNLPPDIFGPSK